MKETGETKSSLALDWLLFRGGPLADAVRRLDIERTSLWRYRKGKTTPPADVASKIEKATKGKVPANGWAEPVKADDAKRAG